MKKLSSLAAGITMLAVSAQAADKPAAPTPAPAPAPVKAEAGAKEFTLVAVQIDKAKLWLPSTIVVKKGDKVRLTLKNMIVGDADKPDTLIHGFAIDEMSLAKVVKNGEETVVEFTADKAGVFRMYCQLHAAHIGGQLIVLE